MAISEIRSASATGREKSKDLRPLRGLIPFIMPYRARLGWAMVALLVAAMATLALPVAVRYVIDHGFAQAMSGRDGAALDRYFLILLILAVVMGAFAALRSYLVQWLGERVVADIRTRIYAHVLSLSPGFFEAARVGEVLSRLTTDTTLVQSIAGVNLSITLRSAVTLLGGLVMLTLTSPRLTGIMVVLIPVVLVPLFVFGRRVRALSRESQDRIADTSGIADETLHAVQTVQAFTLESLQSRRFALAVAEAFSVAVARVRARALLTAFAVIVVFAAVVFVLWLGARAVIEGRMSPGELGQFLLYALVVAGASAALGEMWGEMQRAAGAVERLMGLLAESPRIVVPPRPVPMPERQRGSIVLAGVSFRYPTRPGTPVLSNVDLEVEPGETVALVGPSGAGKSTVFSLLLRFYDVNSGTISLDGVDISGADPIEVRRRLGIVPQDPVVFAETALENIRYGRPDAAAEEIAAAARAAGAHEFISQLPQGYQTYLGERGVRLSGGQRQRIAIARAILKAPAVILLDEATSSLDAESERLVQDGLERLMHHRTTIVIAHRLATIHRADRIVVMDRGRIVASGTHGELVGQGGLYARLAALQFGT